VSVKFNGVKELKVVLKKKADMGAVRQIVKKNGAGLQVKAQRNAPVDTGTLKRSIGLDISDGGLTAESKAGAEYAPYVEWGTRFMEAQPYMKPAFHEQREQFKRDMDRLAK
jgi:phage protein, HK97 gp10 family